MNINEADNVSEIRHSKLNMTSYGVGNIVSDLIGAVLSVMLFAYYETEIGLSTILTGLALIIFAVWDAINDPVVGYFSDRPYKFTKKWGRRFPWIVIFFIPMMFAFLLIFYPPLGASEGLIFTWLIITVCAFDTLESIFIINFFGLFPDKFRNESERITASTIGTYFVIAGVVLGAVLPPMIIVFGEINSYILMAWITVIACLVCYGLFIPGVRDDRGTVENFVDKYDVKKREPFFRELYTALRQKNYVLYLVLILCYFTMTSTWGSSMLYFARYVLGEDQAIIVALFTGVMFIGAMIGAIMWFFYVRKTKFNARVLVYGGLIMVVTATLLTFLVDNISIIITMTINGFGVGGFLIMMAPVFSDVVDESIIRTKSRNEGFLSGFRFFVTNFARVITAIILTIVHILTGFVEGAGPEVQPPEAIIGIRLHTGLIPAMFFLAGIIIFWIFYDITPEKVKNIKNQLIELNL